MSEEPIRGEPARETASVSGDACAFASPDKPKRPLWWKLLGIRRRENARWFRVVPTKWGVLLLLILAGSAGGMGFLEYSMQPDFCRGCHIMEPYYQAWHESTHKGVNCVDCHFEPGLENTIKGKWEASSQAAKFITGTYGSKPHAQVHDASCLRSGCHEQRVLEGKTDWKITTQHGREITIKFDHTPHLSEERRGKHLRCVSCHSQIVQGQHLTVTTDTCFLCHFKGLEHGRNEQAVGGCRGCHEAPKGQIRLATGDFDHADYVQRVGCENCHSDALVGDGAVPRQMCWNCHNQPRQIARYGETSFLHDAHISEHKIECSSCHVAIVHQLDAAQQAARMMKAGVAGGDGAGFAGGGHELANAGTCGSCHEQSHSAPSNLYRGTGGRGVPDMPSPMSRAQVDCIGCHQLPRESLAAAGVTGQTFIAGQSRCDHCHGTKYDGTLVEWKRTIEQTLARATQEVAEARAAFDAAKPEGTRALEMMRLLDDAEHNLRLVKSGHGVHNVTYASAPLSVASENASKVKATAVKQASK